MEVGTPRPLPVWRRFAGLTFGVTWLLGMLVAAWWSRPWWAWLGVAGSGLAWIGIEPRVRRWLTFRWRLWWIWGPFLGWALLFFGAGAARWSWAHREQPELQILQTAAARRALVRIAGVVVKPPQWKGDRLRVVVEVERLRVPPEGVAQPARGRVLVTWNRDQAPELAYGDRVTLRGFVTLPPVWGSFDYRAYLERRGIYALMYDPRVGVLEEGAGCPLLAFLFRFRETARQVVQRLWPDPEAGFFAGVLLGLDSDIPERVYDAFRDTGTAHVIVISGFNIAVLSALFLGVFRRFMPLGWASVLTAGAIALYTLLVGADAAVVRAAIMGGLGLMARHLGRRQHGLTTLVVTAALMALLWPDVLWDVAFQLSFMATLGLILYGQTLVDGFESWVERWLPRPWVRNISGPVGEFLLLTLAAQWTTLPVVVWHFQRISLISPLANVLVLPVQTPLMVLGGVALLVGLLWPGFGQLLAWLAWPWAAYTIRVSEALAQVPWAAVPVERTWVLVGQGFLWLLLERRRLPQPPGFAWRLSISRGAWIAALWALNAVLWHRVARLPDGRLHVWMFPAGSTSALLMRTPSGAYLLVHGGEEGMTLADALGRRLGAERREMAAWVVSSGAREAVAGLLGLWDRYPPREVFWLPQSPGSYAARRLRRWLEEARIPVHVPPEGAVLDLGEEIRLVVRRRGMLSAVWSLEWEGFSLWAGREEDFRDLPGSATVLVFLEDGVGDTCQMYVFPRFRKGRIQGNERFCRLQGEVHLITDGTTLWVETRD